MSKLDELIKNFYPDGVEFDLLAKHVDVIRGRRLTKRDLIDGGEYAVLHGGTSPMGYYDKFNRKKNNTVVVNTGNAGYVFFSEKKFWSSEACFALYPHEKLDDRFLYHVVKRQENFLYSKIRKGAMPTIDADTVKNLVIPVPALEVQREIVRVLDKFSRATTELIELITRELEAREKQFEYYREKLLNTSGQSVTLSEFTHYEKGRINAAEVDENNYIGVDNLLPNKKGKTKSIYVPKSGRLIAFKKGSILIGNIRPYLRKIWFADVDGGTNGDVLAIAVNDSEQVHSKFLYYVLSSEDFFIYAVKNSRGAKMPRGIKEKIMKYQFTLPPLEEQERIAKILDRFEKLCNDLTSGIPAEISARKKQYEYYRDKLLTFQRREK